MGKLLVLGRVSDIHCSVQHTPLQRVVVPNMCVCSNLYKMCSKVCKWYRPQTKRHHKIKYNMLLVVYLWSLKPFQSLLPSAFRSRLKRVPSHKKKTFKRIFGALSVQTHRPTRRHTFNLKSLPSCIEYLSIRLGLGSPMWATKKTNVTLLSMIYWLS